MYNEFPVGAVWYDPSVLSVSICRQNEQELAESLRRRNEKTVIDCKAEIPSDE
jgi:hypothetical protein